MWVSVARQASPKQSARAAVRPQPGPARSAGGQHGPATALLGLQRTVGNRATGHLIQLCRDGHT